MGLMAYGVPSMKPSLEVQVLRGYRLQKTQAKRKVICREAYAERSAERKSEPTNRNRIRGVADRGERAIDREAPATKGRRRRFGGCGRKVWFLTWGDLA